MSMNPLSMPYISMNKDDKNSDGKIDEYNMTLTFKIDPSKVRRVDLLATFDYFVGYRLKMLMVGMIHVSIDTPSGASTIIVDGQIKLKQTRPVLIDSITRSLYNSDPIMDVNYTQFSLDQIIDKYQDRNGKFIFD